MNAPWMPAEWQRASACGSESCIEVRRRWDGIIELRRTAGFCSRRWGGCEPEEWEAFVAGIKAGEFDQFLPGTDAI
jgi:hypothetical protein